MENKQRSDRPPLVTQRDYRSLERTVKNNRRDSLTDITNKFNDQRPRPVCKRTVQNHLAKHGFSKRVIRKKVVVRKENRSKRLSWCWEKRRWPVIGRWNRVIFSDGSQVVIGEDKRILIWRKKGEGYRPDLLPRRPAGDKSKVLKVMVWGCVCWQGVGTLVKVDGNMNRYLTITYGR